MIRRWWRWFPAFLTSAGDPLCDCGSTTLRRYGGRWFCRNWRLWNFWRHRGWAKAQGAGL